MKLRQRQVEFRALPPTRAEAKAVGSPRYFTGKACKNGHISDRLTSIGSCLKCDVEWKRAKRNANPEYARNIAIKSFRKNRDKHLESRKKIYWEKRDVILKLKSADRSNNPEKYRIYRQRAYQKNKGMFVANAAKRRADMISATPKWANKKSIKNIYIDASEMTKITGVEHHVDHVVPLRGRNVCGLHVENNLQIIAADINRKKSNRWEGDDETQG